MRAPKRRRQPPKERAIPPPGVDFAQLAAGAGWVWSAEHKDEVSPAGLPRLRSDATRCPTGLTEEQVLSWLKEPSLLVTSVACGEISPTRNWLGSVLATPYMKLGLATPSRAGTTATRLIPRSGQDGCHERFTQFSH